MQKPLRGDPRRPIYFAVSSCRVLGGLGLLAGTCAGVPLLSRWGWFGLDSLLSLLVLGGGGALFLVLAHHIKRRRFWAVLTATVLVSILTLVFAAGVIGMAYVVFIAQPGLQREPTLLGIEGLYGLITIALGQLLYHLARSFGALKIIAPDEARGFDVLPVAVLASEPSSPAEANGDDLSR